MYPARCFQPFNEVADCHLRVWEEAMDDLRALFFRSFEQFAGREAENILAGTSERNLCARWAPLLEQAAVDAGYGEYRADTEYNRKQGGQVKTILDESMHVVRITCDLILHSRDRAVGETI